MDIVKDGLTPEKVLNILQKHGTKVTLEEAKNVCEMLKKFAKITVVSYLRVH
jgi:hypothetical protein